MCKPIPPGGIVRRPPEEQTAFFASIYGPSLDPARRASFEARLHGLGLGFSENEAVILAALDTPAKVQTFLDNELYYNDDHASVDQDESAAPPRRVLQTGMAHCFEGAMFAFAVNFLHGHGPLLVLLEASQDADHNLVVCQDAQTKLYGSNAQSRYPGLVGRPAEYRTLRALAESYVPFYFSDRTLDPADLTLVGFSNGFDLAADYDVSWMATEEPLWDIYYTYINDRRVFHDFSAAPGEPHLYPLIRALKENWIRIDERGQPGVSLADLSGRAQELWGAFWREFGPGSGPRPRGRAHEIEAEFMRLTGTTPIDLEDNAFDLQFFLAAGYRIDQLLTRK